MWLFGCLLTACLAGLGTPFWYDAVSSLMTIAQRSRNDGSGEAGSQKPTGAPTTPAAGAP